MSFLPKNYTSPAVEGNYLRLKKGTNTFRVLSDAIVGWEAWTTDNKPIRQTESWEERPDNVKRSESGQFQKEFWAFIVWNYESKKVQIMEITQRTIKDALQAYIENPKWGDIKKYDIVVKATGDGLEREYTTIAEPHSEAPKADISKINLEALLLSEDPFTSAGKLEKPDPLNGDSPF